MSKNEKLVGRFLTIPSDFKYSELKLIFEHYGYIEKNKGKTSGSKVAFVDKTSKVIFGMHKPHKKSDSVQKCVLRSAQQHLLNHGKFIPIDIEKK
ncbi:MAG: type II toxin-antitoxin system HicA family toxin [Candidatus Marinimicrobia bacterium]|nr:type II toxin-antitoxin system HicA family toxin [Candidatus Neomarinimicrobiota bacterium]